MAGNDPTRIRQIVERSWNKHVCPLCGFKDFNGGMHAKAGIRGPTRGTTFYCSGKHQVQPKDRPNDFEYQCPQCSRVWFYTQEELNINVGECHECAEKK